MAENRRAQGLRVFRKSQRPLKALAERRDGKETGRFSGAGGTFEWTLSGLNSMRIPPTEAPGGLRREEAESVGNRVGLRDIASAAHRSARHKARLQEEQQKEWKT